MQTKTKPKLESARVQASPEGPPVMGRVFRTEEIFKATVKRGPQGLPPPTHTPVLCVAG